MISEKLDKLYKDEARRISTLSDDRGDYAHPVFGVGCFDTPMVTFIGEAPGKQEAEQGVPFLGKAGEQLRRMLDLSDIDSRYIFITNTVKYRPCKKKQLSGRISVSNRTPDRAEIRQGCVLLEKEISLLSPKVIVTLGNTPLSAIEYITNTAVGKISDVHGKPFELPSRSATLFPLYHPASGIYNRELVSVMEDDLLKLGKLCKRISEV